MCTSISRIRSPPGRGWYRGVPLSLHFILSPSSFKPDSWDIQAQTGPTQTLRFLGVFFL